MINIELPKKYLQLLGKEKLVELWILFEQETREGLTNSVPQWFREKDGNLLRNFFHARRSGALTYGMVSFAECCAEWEKRILSGAAPEEVERQLPDIIAVFENEAAAVKVYLGGKEYD